MPTNYTTNPLFTEEQKTFVLEALESVLEDKEDWEHSRRIRRISDREGNLIESEQNTMNWRDAQQDVAQFLVMKADIERILDGAVTA